LEESEGVEPFGLFVLSTGGRHQLRFDSLRPCRYNSAHSGGFDLMTMMTSAEIRQTFIEFFAARGHTVVPSASLVPSDDRSLLFTNAGMNQFKDVFLGEGVRSYVRAVGTQKCMRVSGKHNDLEDVGRDTSHHTLFEMLGNWSFGDYYKKEAIGWAWTLLTDVYGLEKDRLWATVFRDDRGELGSDEEAAGLWRSETDIDPKHILYFGRKDNFWEMADTGPCGPNSEISYDMGPSACVHQDNPGHVCHINGDCGRYVEIWNLVFMQYKKDAEGYLQQLPAKHVDTGLGFERLTAILQGVDSDYRTDLFLPILNRIQELTGHSDDEVAAHIVAYRVIADHARAISFLIGDGVLPGNEGRNYVLRMILRRAARFGRELGLTEPFLGDVAKVVIATMGSHYPGLEARRQFILTTVAQEEKQFLRTLDLGLAKLDESLAAVSAAGGGKVPGDAAFRLYDTFGLPLAITRDVAKKHGLSVDEEGFRAALDQQRQRARNADVFDSRQDTKLAHYNETLALLKEQGLLSGKGSQHDPYSATELETTVAAILRDDQLVESGEEGDEVGVILPETCFYVESGGQACDTGSIAALRADSTEPVWEIEITDVLQPVMGLIVHRGVVRSGRPSVGDAAWALVDYERRMDVARNHTATHLLHSELRYVLGEHVQQAGSLVTPRRLRFDFTHRGMLTQDELDTVERSVNDTILANYPVVVSEEPHSDAVRKGAIALFGEKYGDTVRVVRIGVEEAPFSQELCGGTHVFETGEIGLFHIVSESGIGTGVRRIEAVTGRGAVELVTKQMGVLQRAAAYLKVRHEEVDHRVLELLDELQTARKDILRLEEQIARGELKRLLGRTTTIGDISLLSTRVSIESIDVLRDMTDWFREQIGSGVVVLGAVVNSRPVLVAAVTRDLAERGISAAAIVKQLGPLIGGGGGGKPTLAQAGGRDAQHLDDALAQASAVLARMSGKE